MPIRLAFLCFLQLVLSTSAFPQDVNNFINEFRGSIEQGMRRAAQGQIAQQRAGQPSFNCTKARTPDEVAICSNPELSELDNAVAAGYQYVLRANGDQFAKQTNTPLFLARQACGAEIACIRERQIDAIRKYNDLGAPVSSSVWDHNGSRVELVANGRSRKFFYETPRAGMLSAGAIPGSLLFEGEAIDEQYVGRAYIFNSRCGQVAYQVSGPILDNYERARLQGQAPRLDAGCRLVGYLIDTLEFTLLKSQDTASALPPSTYIPDAPSPSRPPGPSVAEQFPTRPPGNAAGPKASVPTTPAAPTIGGTKSPDIAALPYKVEGEKAVVEVTGVGATLSEARVDAIRLALQRTMQQLVVVDRLIKDDKVVTDKIYSTLNGYIENFQELEVRHDTGSVSIKAEVTVSPTRIVNFAKVIGGATTEISGGSILGDAQREIEARAIRSEMFGRLFRGVPNDAFDLKITNVHPATDNPQLLELTVNIILNTEWFRQFRTGLEALGQKLLDVPDKTDSSCYNIANGNNEWFKIRDASFGNSFGATPLCVRDDSTHRLYLLPVGNYKDELNRIFVRNLHDIFFLLNGYFPLSIVLGFSNKSQRYKSQCFVLTGSPTSPFKLDLIDHPRAIGLNFVNRALVIRIPIANIDLNRSEQISGALLLPVSSSKFETDMFDDAKDLSDVCENYVYRRALHQ